MAIHIQRVYTRAGDDGKTALIGGTRVSKDHPRVEAYGCLDELNGIVGLCRAAIATEKKIPATIRRTLDAQLRTVQNRLFDIGSVLAAPDGKTWKGMPLPGSDEVSALEKSMDAMNKILPPLKSFVLPGGSAANAWLHHCRTACRRAERRVVTLLHQEKVPVEVVHYLNRLSDWFFVAARHVSAVTKTPETLWEFPLAKAVGNPRRKVKGNVKSKEKAATKRR
jgi:cob(I)alamin adenosyltransferase